MAAKQGLSAHLSQASSDARQAVLTRTPAFIHSHSWLSNLNTTCTIKSAPPRTPEVMTLLSTKSGWLMKRNESHVWQKRWCCVVPHTFLYYFDSCPAPSNCGEEGGNIVAPVGIIDLECYTTVHHCPDAILEITGDAITNPDLRSFYFQGGSVTECQEWTTALLSDRHGALRDEREAYRQVCETFPLQLKGLSDEIDEKEDKIKKLQEEAYRIRCTAEDCRKRVISAVKSALEKGEEKQEEDDDSTGIFEELTKNRKRLYVALDRAAHGAEAVSMNAGVVEGVEILNEYSHLLYETLKELSDELKRQKETVRQSKEKKIDRKELERLQTKMDRQSHTHEKEMRRLHERIAFLESTCQSQKQENADLTKNLESKKMEFEMLSTASKRKITELTSHKKILKREVIDMRKKMDEIVSDVTAYQHKSQGLDVQVRAERERNEFLERHLNQVVHQIKLQEKMLDMMSQSGSVCGGSVVGREFTTTSSITPSNNPASNCDDSKSVLSFSSERSSRPMPPLPPKFNSSNVSTGTNPSSTPRNRDQKRYSFPNSSSSSLFNSTTSVSSPLPPRDSSKPPPIPNNNHVTIESSPQLHLTSSTSTTTAKNNSPTTPQNAESKKPLITVSVFDSASPESHSPITSPVPLRSGNNDTTDDASVDDDNVSALTEDRTYSSHRGGGSTYANNTNPNQPPASKLPQFSQSLQHSQQQECSMSSSHHSSCETPGRLSTAQRSRMEANSPMKRNVVRLPPPPTGASTSASMGSKSRSNSPSVWERLGKTISEVVDSTPLGVKEGVSSGGSVTGSTDGHKYTLAERQRMQREKQMQFLKSQGLIQGEVAK